MVYSNMYPQAGAWGRGNINLNSLEKSFVFSSLKGEDNE